MKKSLEPNNNGQLQQTDFIDNTGGVNLSDSVFRIQDNQAAGGYNFDYLLTGGFRKRLGPSKINTIADAQLRSLGFGVYAPASGSKSTLRAAGTKLQLLDTSALTFTSLTDDTVSAASSIFSSSSTQTVQFAQFNNGASNVLWAAGGGLTFPYGAYSTSKMTQNGSRPASGKITLTVNPSAGGFFPATGVFTYAIVIRKASTQALSNASLDVNATLSNVADTVKLDFTTLTAFDTTLYDAIYIYRSALSGGSGFTTGDLIAILPSTAKSFTDYYISIASSQNIPRAGSIILDNSTLPSNSIITAPTGVLAKTVNSLSNGIFQSAGSCVYALAYRDTQTQNLSIASLDISATILNTSDTVTIDFTGLTGLNTTTVDAIYLFRSPVGGSSGYTLGDLVTILGSNVTTFTDIGDSITTGLTITRTATNISPYNFNNITVFKRRLVAAQGSTVYLSEVNKSESWPLTNQITIPSAGNITALAVISFTSPQAQTLDEILVIYKEREMWVITGTDYTDFALKFIDQVGCLDQSLVVLANGFLAWIDFRGVYLWDGTSKPIYCSRLIENLFARDGDLDKSKLALGTGEFYRKENQIIWYLSSKLFGEQKFALKMDLRLTLPLIEQNLTGRNIDAILIPDVHAFPIYAALSYIPQDAADEQMLLGDASGFCYFAANGFSDGGSDFSLKYLTKALNMGDPNTNKLFHKVIVWVQDIGTWNLTLDYWSNYKTTTDYQSTKSMPLSQENINSVALWDIAYWDVANWDNYTPNVVPLIFNLDPGVANSNQGTAIQLQFRNDFKDQPIVIHGFSVIWSEFGGVTA